LPLDPIDSTHAAQIQAGILGRKTGHKFEFELAAALNALPGPISPALPTDSVFRAEVAPILAALAVRSLGLEECDRLEAVSLGALATAEEGKNWLRVNDIEVRACKSDVLLTAYVDAALVSTVGVSVKQCNNPKPTNAQLYFTTAHAFCELLRRNGIAVSVTAERALRQFCGDSGYTPNESPEAVQDRLTDPRRFFWEETDSEGRIELEDLLTQHQDEITRLLLQKAYLDDPFAPELLLHKTRQLSTDPQEYALYTVAELVERSRRYQGFSKKLYSVRKGQYKDPPGVQHEAPRFGIVQMQRGGQKQHPTQLQFNLEAGYFYKI